MKIEIAREVAARIWCDPKMSNTVMDADLAEEIAQLLSARLTPAPLDACACPPEIKLSHG
jgi:hypothetical protein